MNDEDPIFDDSLCNDCRIKKECKIRKGVLEQLTTLQIKYDTSFAITMRIIGVLKDCKYYHLNKRSEDD